jgi:aminopeptidase N
VAWDDYALFSAGLIEAEQATLDQLPGATVYHIDLQIPDDFALLQGQEQVLYTNQEREALDEVCFRLYANAIGGTVSVSALKVDGQDVEPVYEGLSSVLRVPLLQALQPGEQVVIFMDFEVEPPRHLNNNYGTFSYVDGVLALDGWYPVVAVYDDEGAGPGSAKGWNLDVRSSGDLTYLDASFYLVRVTAPAALTIIASGGQVGHEREGGRQIATFAAGPSRDFYLVASDRYTVVSATVGETAVNSYAPAEHVDGAELALEFARGALGSFNERLGVYPYTKFDIVSTPMQAIGVEYAGVVVLAFDAYDLDMTMPGVPPVSLESVIAHETAHQWFYNVVGNDQSDQPWLDEAIVQYVTGLYHLDVGGERAAQDWRDYLYYRWGYADQAEIPIGLSLTDYADGREYSGIVYGRGPLFVAALAEEMGQDTFDGFLRDYYESHKWGIGTTATFRQLAEQHCQCDLTALFEEWVYEDEK